MNCDRCGRWLPDFDCPNGAVYKTIDGLVCGCCIEEYLEEKGIERRLKELNLLAEE